VRNLRNNRSLVLKINDRGPFVTGRIIDLSVNAAKELGIYYAGTGPVEVIALGMEPETLTVSDKVEKRNFVPVDYDSGFFTFQVGAFSSLENARELRQRLEQVYKNVKIKTTYVKTGVVYRVLVGRCSSLEKAQHYSNILKKHGFKDVLVIAE
jgi:rare lipoprotein A